MVARRLTFLCGICHAFLLSFKEKEPKWDLLGVEGAKDMPAVKWKLVNLTKMGDDKHKEAVEKLKRIIESV